MLKLKEGILNQRKTVGIKRHLEDLVVVEDKHWSIITHQLCITTLQRRYNLDILTYRWKGRIKKRLVKKLTSGVVKATLQF